jgi:hypothetical protein
MSIESIELRENIATWQGKFDTMPIIKYLLDVIGQLNDRIENLQDDVNNLKGFDE